MTAELSSTRVPRVAAARRLTKRAFRAQERRFLVEGPQAVREALGQAPGSPAFPTTLFVTGEAAERHPALVERAREGGAEVLRASGAVLAALTSTVTPQGVVAVSSFVDVPFEEILRTRPRLVAVLASVRDPGNAGTVLRVADAAGADGVVLTDASVDVYNSKCVRASAGSLFHLPVAVGVPLAEAAQRLRAAGMSVLAADGSGSADLDDALDDGTLDRPTAWVFGNEAWGLPPEHLALADAAVRVPIHGAAESLNLATAAAVCLYASARCHRRAADRPPADG